MFSLAFRGNSRACHDKCRAKIVRASFHKKLAVGSGVTSRSSPFNSGIRPPLIAHAVKRTSEGWQRLWKRCDPRLRARCGRWWNSACERPTRGVLSFWTGSTNEPREAIILKGRSVDPNLFSAGTFSVPRSLTSKCWHQVTTSISDITSPPQNTAQGKLLPLYKWR